MAHHQNIILKSWTSAQDVAPESRKAGEFLNLPDLFFFAFLFSGFPDFSCSILDSLIGQDTQFPDPDYKVLYLKINNKFPTFQTLVV